MNAPRRWLERLSVNDGGAGFWTARRATVFNLLQVSAWVGLAEWRLPRASHFLTDEAEFYSAALAVARSGVPAAFGPPISQTDPVAYTPGGGLFDLYAVPFLFTRNPVWGAAWVALLTAGGALMFDRVLCALGASGRMRVIACALATWGIWHARFADRLWNGDAFLFVVPLLWWLSVRWASSQRWFGVWALGWGACAALAMQVHASGVVPVVTAVALAWPARGGRRRTLTSAALAVGGGVLAYAPWLWTEVGRGFADAVALGRARPPGHALGVGVGRSLAVFAKFASQSGRVAERLPSGASIFEVFGLATFGLAAVLGALGLCVRGRWRGACLLTFALVPAFLALTGREYFDHYVIASFPLYCVPSAAALSAWAGRARGAAGFVLVYVCLFVVIGVGLVLSEFSPQEPAWTAPTQLEITRRLVDVGQPIAMPESSVAGMERRVYEVLARDALGVPLTFSPDGVPCQLISGSQLQCGRR